MRIDQVAAQLYTVREFIRTPDDIASSLKKIREIGYRSVQVSAMGPIEEEELVRILDGEGLTCCATHEPGGMILDTPEKVVERLGKLNCKYTAYPYPAGIDMADESQVADLAGKLDRSGAVLREAGRVLTYHNHGLEFIRPGERLALEIIYGDTDPANLQGEIDTYWVQYGGGDCVDWCTRLRNRLPLIHLKDYKFTNQNAPTMCEIGSGTLNWKAILKAAEASGCEWFIVEQDECPGDPFDSLRMSYDFIRENLASE